MYGGSAVSVIERQGDEYKTKKAALLTREQVRTLASRHTELKGAEVIKFVRNKLKAEIKELMLRALSHRLYNENEGNNDPFWTEIETSWGALLSRHSDHDASTVPAVEFFDVLKPPLSQYFNILLSHEKTENPRLWRRLEIEMTKARKIVIDPAKKTKALELLLLNLEHFIAAIRFKKQGGGGQFKELLGKIKSAVDLEDMTNYIDLESILIETIDSFFKQRFNVTITDHIRGRIQSALLEIRTCTAFDTSRLS